MKHLLLCRRIVLFKSNIYDYNRRLYFPHCDTLFIRNCTSKFIEYNITNEHFPKLKNVSIATSNLMNDYVDKKYLKDFSQLCKTNNWNINEYRSINKYRFYMSNKSVYVDIPERIWYGMLK